MKPTEPPWKWMVVGGGGGGWWGRAIAGVARAPASRTAAVARRMCFMTRNSRSLLEARTAAQAAPAVGLEWLSERSGDRHCQAGVTRTISPWPSASALRSRYQRRVGRRARTWRVAL